MKRAKGVVTYTMPCILHIIGLYNEWTLRTRDAKWSSTLLSPGWVVPYLDQTARVLPSFTHCTSVSSRLTSLSTREEEVEEEEEEEESQEKWIGGKWKELDIHSRSSPSIPSLNPSPPPDPPDWSATLWSDDAPCAARSCRAGRRFTSAYSSALYPCLVSGTWADYWRTRSSIASRSSWGWSSKLSSTQSHTE